MVSKENPVSLEEGWLDLSEGVEKLQRLLEGYDETPFDSNRYIQLYTVVYNLCTQKPKDCSEELYKRYQQLYRSYFEKTVVRSVKGQNGNALLKELSRRWNIHKVMVRWLSRFFNYLDRYYIPRNNLQGLRDLGIVLFGYHVHCAIQQSSTEAILILLNNQREGERIDGSLVKNVIEIFVEVGNGDLTNYETSFEQPFLARTGDFYRREASLLLETHSCPEYMIKAEAFLSLEEFTIARYMHESTTKKLMICTERELVERNHKNLLEKEGSGLIALLENDNREDLARMFRLFKRIPAGLQPIADCFRRHVEKEGSLVVGQATQAANAQKESGKAQKDRGEGSWDHQFLWDILALFKKYSWYVEYCFSNHFLFSKAIKEAFETTLNKDSGGCSSAEILANFCDTLLKKGSSASDESLEETLDRAVRLLAFISDKDLFGEFFRKKLSRRLLWDKSASDENERGVLTRLKQMCGAQFTSKMEGMLTDLQLAREKQIEFDEWKNSEQPLGYDMTVTVLTTGFWPSYKQTDLALPQEMVDGVSLFKKFYGRNIQHRKLGWIYSLGMCHIKGNFDVRPVELILSTFQAAVLMLFNEDAQMEFSEIKERLNLPAEDLTRLLHSLACAKYKILNKIPASRVVASGDRFALNTKFTDKMRRIRIPVPPVDEKKKVLEEVDQDRRFSIDAAIVRVMKSRKTLQHQQLTIEVVNQVSGMFKADFKLIKKRIEDLMSRDYLERDANNPNILKYLA